VVGAFIRLVVGELGKGLFAALRGNGVAVALAEWISVELNLFGRLILLADPLGVQGVVENEGLWLVAHVRADLALDFFAFAVEVLPGSFALVKRVFARFVAVELAPEVF
jgi:hypothetical protein